MSIIKAHYHKVVEFARKHDLEPEEWMKHQIWWGGWIGCEVCTEGGRDAPCWGKTECHGYYNGCGCERCRAADASLRTDVEEFNRLTEAAAGDSQVEDTDFLGEIPDYETEE